MNDYTIGEAARILGVTPRTLRYWEARQLLVPGWRTHSDYRLYTEDDLQRGFAIIMFKNAGLTLADIGTLLSDDSTASRLDRLRKQREVLASQLLEVHTMIAHLDQIITTHEEQEITMENLKKAFGDDMPGYQEEAEQRFGHTDQWAQAQSVLEGMTPADMERTKKDHLEFADALASAREQKVAPGSPQAAKLVLAHRTLIGQWYEVTPARQVILARMYVADARFDRAYRGNADYLLELIEAQARAEGVDLGDVSWQ